MKLEQVYGVSKDPVASYIERPDVDDRMIAALKQTRQVIVYGSSKQGKSALVQRHIPASARVTVHCSPATTAEDLYRSLLRQLKVDIVTERTNESSREVGVSISAKFTAMIPFFGSGEAETEGSTTAGNTNGTTRQAIEFNLALAQDVGELLLQVTKSKTYFIIENFHYLIPQVQTALAFDLRTFEEMGLRFVILGVWREANRLVQYNGDLQDRIAEVPVEPWDLKDFERIVSAGEPVLNVKFSEEIKTEIFAQSHGSVAVVQELLKKLCEILGITETCTGNTRRNIDDMEVLKKAISAKVEEYAARHVRSLESIAAGSRNRRATEETAALYLPYYLVNVLVHRTFQELRDGIERKTLRELIRQIHTTPDNVRTSDVTGMLLRLPTLQADANIVPPLFDFDRGTRRVKAVDSTLYFFIDNCNPDEVMDEIPHPDPDIQARNECTEIAH